ncbi:MAG: glycosyltransferase [Candidatus Methanofastidiosum sp.]|nr:glycosyltransferase [Methanofastidiosum sp.]
MEEIDSNETVYSKRKNITKLKVPALREYSKVVGKEKIHKLKELAKDLNGIKILEVNSTAFGGGVAEMLKSSVPFLNEIGIEDDWKVMKGTDEFFTVTKSIHNLLQGKKQDFTKNMEDIYVACTEANVKKNIIDEHYDVITVHDPQPLGLASYLKKEKEKWLWRCHIDLDIDVFLKNENLEKLITKWASYYDSAIFSNVQYVVSSWNLPKFIIPPYIDPLSEKNKELKQDYIDEIIDKYNIQKNKPIILQVSRFDKWKDPVGLISIYKNVKKMEDCQLVLIGSMANDDPESILVLEDVKQKIKHTKDVHILLNLPDIEVNAIQRAATVVVQNSIKEGFGLTVTEALWKEKAVVGRPVGGLTLQIVPNKNGFLLYDTDKRIETIVMLLRNPEKRETIGKRAKKFVKQRFLMPGRAYDYLLAVETMEFLPKESIVSFHPWYEL